MVLIITYDSKEYFFPYIIDENISVVNVLKKNNKFFRIVRHLPVLYRFAFNKNIKKYAKIARKIIIFDSAYTEALGKYLKNKNILVYFWNPIRNTKKILSAKRWAQVYSFDKYDCEKFDVQFSPMIYCKNVMINYDHKETYSLFFLGAGKDRVDTLVKIYDELLYRIPNSCYIIVGKNDIEEKQISEQFIFSEKRYSYYDYLKYISKSKILLDIPQKGQSGNTIRVVESLFFRKKLITTNANVKEYDFYDENNIFIIGIDEEDRLEEFILSPFKDINSSIIEKYDISKWVDVMDKVGQDYWSSVNINR